MPDHSSGFRPPPTDAALNTISQEFAYSDIAEATSGFGASHRLGEGSYGTVYRGTLRDGTEVAIKALASPKEGGFREEVEVLSRFRHPNLVILMGFARNGRERLLVYELLPGGDLNARLNKDASFTWRHRLSVVLDAALGLSHLHGSRPKVFHRDIKTQNILMDRNGGGKVADFGLACLAQVNKRSLAVNQTSGTIGYADPLYIRTGVITEKSEVYSLGMVLLEVLTGRPPALQHPNGRVEYQFEHLAGEVRRLQPMVDKRGQWPAQMVDRVGQLALVCTCETEGMRPSFVDIVTKLRQWLREDQPQNAWQSMNASVPPQPQQQRPQHGQHPQYAPQPQHNPQPQPSPQPWHQRVGGAPDRPMMDHRGVPATPWPQQNPAAAARGFSPTDWRQNGNTGHASGRAPSPRGWQQQQGAGTSAAGPRRDSSPRGRLDARSQGQQQHQSQQQHSQQQHYQAQQWQQFQQQQLQQQQIHQQMHQQRPQQIPHGQVTNPFAPARASSPARRQGDHATAPGRAPSPRRPNDQPAPAGVGASGWVYGAPNAATGSATGGSVAAPAVAPPPPRVTSSPSSGRRELGQGWQPAVVGGYTAPDREPSPPRARMETPGAFSQEEPLLAFRHDPAQPPSIVKEEDIQALMAMGYNRTLVMEAFRRSSSKEGAANWIIEQG